MLIREERPADAAAIHAVNVAAFGTTTEADLVNALRRDVAPLVSLVAEDDAEVVGHIMFSPVTASGAADIVLMGLAPMAVVPSRQRQGIGSLLVREGLTRCQRLGAAAVVVLGHPAFYPRFGFVPATTKSLRSEYDVPEDVFMVLMLRELAPKELSGTIQYHRVFKDLCL